MSETTEDGTAGVPLRFNPHKIWQKSFYDHIIRGGNDLQRIQEYILKNSKNLTNDVHVLPIPLDMKIAALKLKSLGIKIDTLTSKQEKYLSEWREGTV
jgi:S-adenosylhomocysteine hydrolase